MLLEFNTSYIDSEKATPVVSHVVSSDQYENIMMGPQLIMGKEYTPAPFSLKPGDIFTNEYEVMSIERNVENGCNEDQDYLYTKCIQDYISKMFPDCPFGTLIGCSVKEVLERDHTQTSFRYLGQAYIEELTNCSLPCDDWHFR